MTPEHVIGQTAAPTNDRTFQQHRADVLALLLRDGGLGKQQPDDHARSGDGAAASRRLGEAYPC